VIGKTNLCVAAVVIGIRAVATCGLPIVLRPPACEWTRQLLATLLPTQCKRATADNTPCE
jgi:hypothetical protein